jgi:Protein of unknown function (DUF3768)
MSDRGAVIAALNDEFRTSFRGGHLVITSGVHALGQNCVGAILCKVSGFNQFTRDNDPHREHDFGAFEHNGERLFWKIDYFDSELQFGSEDPTDPHKTTRVLTIMLAQEY